NQSSLQITLVESQASLDEIVVVGYGSMQKRHLTGSVGSVKMDETLASRPVVDFGQAMYGKVAGVNIMNPSGRPGESSRVQIRGVTSLSAGNEPLIVVDGVPLPDFDLNSINAADIESIDILKDASSAAIYGSRGANGVVLVTTKSGKAGRETFNVNYTFTTQRVMNKVDVMTGPEYAQAAIDAAQNGWINSGGDPNAPNTIEARGQYRYTWPISLENPETLWNTDFQDLIYRVAPMHLANLNFSGGSEKTTYFFSAGIVDQQGIVLKSDYQKYSMNMKANSKINSWLTVGGMFNVNYENEQVPHPNTSQAAVQYPSIYPVYGNGGFLGGPNSVDGFENHYGILIRAFNAHPLHWNSDEDLRHRINASANLYTEVGILPGLKFRSSIYTFYRRSDRKLYVPGNTGLATDRVARASSSMNRTVNLAAENLLVYNKSWNGHNLDAVAGYEFNHREIYLMQGERREFENDLIPYLSAGNVIYNTSDADSEYSLVSILSRVNYNYMDKYMVSGTFRRDGSSRFGPENKFGIFPSVSAGWRVSEEDFMKEQNLVSNLNFRASYGLTGNDNFGNYQWVSAMSQGRAAIGDNLFTVYSPSSIQNPDLAWERSKQLNLGLDLGFFENRVFLETDFFTTVSDGLLLDVPVPSITGFTSVFQNIGSMESNGVELNLITQNLVGPLDWNSQITFSRIRSKITSLGPDNAPMYLQRANMGIINQVGQTPFSFFGYAYDGVFLNQDQIDSDPVEYPFPVYPGDGKYKDVNEDGVINADDRTILGNAQPDFNWAVTNNFKFKNFDLSFLFHGSVGGDFYFADNRRSLFYHEGRNYLAEVNNRWRSPEEPGDGHHYKLSVDLHGLEKLASSYWLTDGTYTRLKDLTFGYTLSEEYTTRLGLSGLRIFFNGTNLLTIQSTTAIDPENSSGSITDPSTMGVQHSPYPTAKTYSFGLNVKF
ncbi:MAG: TonB-dependent receptor, partial [Cyclobacteriaceae bacterium]